MGSRWYIAFFLLTVYVQPAGGIRELLKIPVLAEHFADHRSESKGISLMNFLVSHYCTEDGTDPDADEDSKLPFKTTEQITSPGAITLGLPISADAIDRVSFVQVRNFLIMDDDDIPSLFLDAIWQPPRSC